jgi:hypothetical protein
MMSAGHDNGSCDLSEQIRALYSELALHPEKDFGWGHPDFSTVERMNSDTKNFERQNAG